MNGLTRKPEMLGFHILPSFQPSPFAPFFNICLPYMFVNADHVKPVLQGELGDVVYVDLPRVGSTFKAGDVFGSVESVKAASDVYSPVSGEIAEVNDELLKNPAMINDDPEGAGWMIKMKLSPGAETEINSMMEDKDYIEFTSKH
uniref:Lipoyl-binding domain-containing protein n=1 Tax=Spongospora subterranea TaxID=70186 RepID=A0A0H5QID6_9EUKA|eukprot:CRZ01810.1 hypothetical protein [Spongospora subterranea]